MHTITGTRLNIQLRTFLLLAGAHRRQAGPTAPPHGLSLTGVRFAGEPEGIELVGIP